MTTDRIKEIHETTAYPESRSVYQALLQVWNECQQEHNSQPPNLDLKCTAEFELLSEPLGYKQYISGTAPLELWDTDVKKECKAYQQALTYRQRIDELIEYQKSAIGTLKTYDSIIGDCNQQITQLTKENQELKIKAVSKGNALIIEQGKLQAAEDRIKELEGGC